jgi:hypothetical protein
VTADDGKSLRRRAAIFAAAAISVVGSLLLWASLPTLTVQSVAGWLTLILFVSGLAACAAMALPDPSLPRLLRIHLGPWLGLGFALSFGVGTWALRTPSEWWVGLDPGVLLSASVVAMVGLSFATLAYRTTPRFIVRGFTSIDNLGRGRTHRSANLGGAIVLWLVSLSATAIQFRGNLFGYLADPTAALTTTSSANAALSTLASVGGLATLIAAWIHGREPRAGTRWALVVIASSQIVTGLFSGYKEPVVIQLFALLLGYGLTRRVRVTPIVLSALFVVIFVFPFVAQYRDQISYGSVRLTPAQAASRVDYGALASDSLQGSRQDLTEVPLQRLTRIVDLAVILSNTPTPIAYKPTSELLAGPLLGFVPRSLWREKPVLDAGLEMSHVYYGIPDTVITFSAMTPYGDLWRHGGLAVVAFGMGFVGILLRSVDGRPGDAAEDPTVLFLPFLLLPAIAKQEIDYLALCASIPQTLLASWLAARIVTAAYASKQSAPSWFTSELAGTDERSSDTSPIT